MSETKEPWKVEQLERKNTTKMNKIANSPLDKRKKEYDENQELKGEVRLWNHSGRKEKENLIRWKELEKRTPHSG